MGQIKCDECGYWNDEDNDYCGKCKEELSHGGGIGLLFKAGFALIALLVLLGILYVTFQALSNSSSGGSTEQADSSESDCQRLCLSHDTVMSHIEANGECICKTGTSEEQCVATCGLVDSEMDYLGPDDWCYCK